MRRFTTQQKSEINQLTQKGFSLNQISRVTHLNKTSVYYHFRKIRGRTMKKPEINFDSKKELGEVIGIFSGDGSLCFLPKTYNYQVRVHFGINDTDYLQYVKNLYEKVFKKKFILKKAHERELIIETLSVDIFNFFHKFLNFKNQCKSLTVSLNRDYENDREFLTGFLKGFLDTDGTIFRTNGQTGIVFYTSSRKLSQQTSKILRTFKINHGISKDKRYKNICYQIRILKRSVNEILNLLKPFNLGR